MMKLASLVGSLSIRGSEHAIWILGLCMPYSPIENKKRERMAATESGIKKAAGSIGRRILPSCSKYDFISGLHKH